VVSFKIHAVSLRYGIVRVLVASLVSMAFTQDEVKILFEFQISNPCIPSVDVDADATKNRKNDVVSERPRTTTALETITVSFEVYSKLWNRSYRVYCEWELIDGLWVTLDCYSMTGAVVMVILLGKSLSSIFAKSSF
jgi:hypothetical protein